MRHNQSGRVATIEGVRVTREMKVFGEYRKVYRLNFGESVPGPFGTELDGGEFLAEAITLESASEITDLTAKYQEQIVNNMQLGCGCIVTDGDENRKDSKWVKVRKAYTNDSRDPKDWTYCVSWYDVEPIDGDGYRETLRECENGVRLEQAARALAQFEIDCKATLESASEITGVYVSVCDGIVQDVFPNKDVAIQDMRRHVVNTLVGCCGGVIKSETETRWEVDFAAKNRREVCEVVRFDPNNEEHRKAYNAERSIWHLPELAPLESMSEIKEKPQTFTLNSDTMGYIKRIRSIIKHFGKRDDCQYLIRRAIMTVCNRLCMSNCLYSVWAWEMAATGWYGKLEEIYNNDMTTTISDTGYTEPVAA